MFFFCIMKKVTDAYEQAKKLLKGRLDGHYQHEGVKWMLERELDKRHGGILADDMGMGKTMQAIGLMRGNQVKTLIVSIVGTVNQWRDALIEFGGYKPIIINPSFSGILPDKGVEVCITTYSSFQKVKPAACLTNTEWGRVILDEGHLIRNPATKLFKEINKINADLKWILSGTPVQNSHKDLITLAKFIGIATKEVDDIVNNIVLRRTQEGQGLENPRLALPPLNTEVVKLEFNTPEEKALYDAVEDYFMENSNKNTFEAIESLTRCRQVCTNPFLYKMGMSKKKLSGSKRKAPDFDDYIKKEDITSTKTTWLVEAVKKHKGKCLIFCIWTGEMKYIQDALEKEGIASLMYDGHLSRDNKESVLYNFKNTEIPVLLIQITCGSSGLNLQCASMVFITSPHWNPCVELQAIGRSYRKGQTECVKCVRLVIAGTVEEKCMEIQYRKMQYIKDTMNDDSLMMRLGGDASSSSSQCDDLEDIKEIFSSAKKPKLTESASLEDLLDAYLFDAG